MALVAACRLGGLTPGCETAPPKPLKIVVFSMRTVQKHLFYLGFPTLFLFGRVRVLQRQPRRHPEGPEKYRKTISFLYLSSKCDVLLSVFVVFDLWRPLQNMISKIYVAKSVITFRERVFCHGTARPKLQNMCGKRAFLEV